MFDVEAAIVASVRAGRVKVPPYPAAAMKLTGLLGNPNYSMPEVVGIVKADQMLAAATLRLANSVEFQRGNPTTNLTMAVQRLGAKHLQALAMAVGVQGAAQRGGPLSSLRRRAWFDGLCSARVCELLAKLHKESPEESFVAGLLHDLGKLLTISTIEELIGHLPKDESRTEEAWWEVVEKFHVELGMVLAARWKLPPALERVVIDHHEPSPEPGMLRRVQVSDEVVKLLGGKPSVSAHDLGLIGDISTQECEALAAGLESLPAFINSFELEATAESAAQSKIVTEVPVVGSVAGRAVAITGASTKPTHAPVVLIEGPRVFVQSEQPLRTNVLVIVKFDTAPDTTFCAKVISSAESKGTFISAIAPFALSPKQHQQWMTAADLSLVAMAA